MKRLIQIGMIILLSLSLISCACKRFCAYPPHYFTEDCWQRQLVMNPNCWLKHADRWFFSGAPNKLEVSNRHASPYAAMSTVHINVPCFTNIVTNGDFQLQLFGAVGHDSVYLLGPNAGVIDVSVAVHGSTLCVLQRENSPCVKNVIVRVGVTNLHTLKQLGSGPIEAVQIKSDCLRIKSAGYGNIYLAGQNINLNKVCLYGCGSVNVFGVNTCKLDIKSIGWGCINLMGRIGLRSIVHGGRGDINIIGARSPCLNINAGGCGKISINGPVTVGKISARDDVQIYLSRVTSNKILANLSGSARVGMRGFVYDLVVNTGGCSLFWGKDLCSINAYVTTHDQSHVNVTARKTIFASAANYSSIYFYGSPKALTQFATGYANIIPMSLEEPSCCIPPCVSDLK